MTKNRIIPITNVANYFDEHINYNENYRILFSGRYGIGKTFFLEEYFTRREDVNALFISPVNYVVGSNENIFEYIKFDILFQLYHNERLKLPETIELDDLDALTYHFLGNPERFLPKLITFLGKIDALGQGDNDSIRKGIAIVEAVKQLQAKMGNRNMDNLGNVKDRLSEYIQLITESAGSPYERNVVSAFIQDVLKYIGTEKRNILIIDDFDRLDPDHVFRILNILSAHNNSIGTRNKFGFEQVIIVCDLENIAKMFAYRYGDAVDFEGYMDKFYSLEIFRFSNMDAVDFYLEQVMTTDLGKGEELLLKYLLRIFVAEKSLTVRQLMKYRYFKGGAVPDVVIHSAKVEERPPFIAKKVEKIVTYSSEVKLIEVLKILSLVFGDYLKVIEKLDRHRKSKELIDLKIEDLWEIREVFILPDLIAGKLEMETLVYYHLQYGEASDWRYPELNFVSHLQYRLKFAWDERLMYDGSVKYFNEMKLVYEKKIHRVEKISKMEFYRGASYVKYDVFDSLRKFSEYLRTNDYLRQLGMNG